MDAVTVATNDAMTSTSQCCGH